MKEQYKGQETKKRDTCVMQVASLVAELLRMSGVSRPNMERIIHSLRDKEFRNKLERHFRARKARPRLFNLTYIRLFSFFHAKGRNVTSVGCYS